MKELSARLRETGALLVSHLQSKNRQLSQAYLETLSMVIHATEAQDKYLQGHSQRVRELVRAIGQELSVPAPELYALEISALLHDMGMSAIPESILEKAGPLQEEEHALIRKHPGAAKSLMEDISYLTKSIPHVYAHHERHDGRGYPESAAGDQIPLSAKILALAEAYDALTSDRAHRQAYTPEKALEMIESESGRQFDPRVVAGLKKVLA
jgi:HD-GYP domain-containing protein (c-di-GMP phosphodiesterase class II)